MKKFLDQSLQELLYGTLKKILQESRIIRYQKAGFRGTLSSIWDICAIAIIIAYFIIYPREKEGNEDKDSEKDR